MYRGGELNIGPDFASAYAQCCVFVSRHQAVDQTTVVYTSASDFLEMCDRQCQPTAVNAIGDLLWMHGLMLDKNTQQHGYTMVLDASDACPEMWHMFVRVHRTTEQSTIFRVQPYRTTCIGVVAPHIEHSGTEQSFWFGLRCTCSQLNDPTLHATDDMMMQGVLELFPKTKLHSLII